MPDKGHLCDCGTPVSQLHKPSRRFFVFT